MYGYTLKALSQSSEKYGDCEVCHVTALNDVYMAK
jgi:hypothetical protein